jgi:hypothetical protein
MLTCLLGARQLLPELLNNAFFSRSVLICSTHHRASKKAAEMASSQIDLNIASVIFLSVLSHFVPPWADRVLLIAMILWNLRIAAKFKFILPNWFVLLLIVQIMSLISGFNSDHDPFDGEWGGKSEPNEWL